VVGRCRRRGGAFAVAGTGQRRGIGGRASTGGVHGTSGEPAEGDHGDGGDDHDGEHEGRRLTAVARSTTTPGHGDLLVREG